MSNGNHSNWTDVAKGILHGIVNGHETGNNLVTPDHNVTNATTTPTPSTYYNRHMIGMALALGGNLLISVSLSVQKKAHNRLGQESQIKYCLDKWWWLGMFLMVCGEVGNFMAYGFAPASLVAPLGSVAVIANAVIAVVFLREPLTMPSIMGVTLVIVGSITLISFSVNGKPMLNSALIVSYLKAWPFLLYIGIEVVVLAVLLYLKYVRKNEHMIILLLLVGIIASVTVIAAKALSTMISETILQGHQHVFNAVFWVSLIILPITTVTQIRYLNRAMQLYDVSDVAPVNFMFFTVSAILAGAMFYQEFSGVGFDRVFMFVFGCIQSFIGVYIITKQEEYKGNRSDDDNENRKRCGTEDSGLDPGSSGGENTDSSFSSRTISMTDSEAPSPGKVTVHRDPLDDRAESKHLVPSGGAAVNTAPAKKCANILKDLVTLLKESEQISRVQPTLEESQQPSTSK